MRKPILIFIIIFFSVILFISYKKIISVKPQNSNKTTESLMYVSQTINGSKKSYQIKKGKTALNLLEETNAIITSGKGENAFVTVINNIKADPLKKEYWAFYVNEKPANIGAGSYYLQSNDNIVWKIEKY